MRGSRIFRVNILSKRQPFAHSIRSGCWRWNIVIEDTVIASGMSANQRAMKRETLAVQKEYLQKHPNLQNR